MIDADLDELDRATAAIVRTALHARADEIEPTARPFPATSRRRFTSNPIAIVAVAAILVLIATLTLLSFDNDSSSDPTHLSTVGDDSALLPGWLPEGLSLRTVEDTGQRMDDTLWLRVYRTGIGPDFPLIQVQTQRGSNGQPTQTTIAGRAANVQSGQFGGSITIFGLDCGATTVSIDNVDSQSALAFLESLHCEDAVGGSAGALTLPTDYQLLFDGPMVGLFSAFRWTLYYEAAVGQAVTLAFGGDTDPANRLLFLLPIAQREFIERAGRTLTLVTTRGGTGLYLSWREPSGFVELLVGGYDRETALRVADSLQRVSEDEFDAAVNGRVQPRPTRPVTTAPPDNRSTSGTTPSR